MEKKFNFAIIQERQDNEDAAHRTLASAKKLEKKRLKQGWRYIRIAHNTLILVECDKDGNPTKRAQEHIAEQRKKISLLLK